MVLPEVNPLPQKAVFKKHHVKLGQVARHVGISYSFLSNVLSGNARASERVMVKLDELVDQLEGRKR